MFQNTRQRRMIGDTYNKPTGGGRVTIPLPRSGILGDVMLAISGTVAGGLSAPNALGMASIIRRIQLQLNNGLNVVDISGWGYCYLLAPMLDMGQDVTPQNTGKNAVTATTFNLDCKLPVAINNKEELGMILLQNTDVIATLVIDFEADASVATGATVTATVTPIYTLYDVPASRDNMPYLGAIHRLTEDSQAVAAAGTFDYQWPIGNVFLSVAHLLTSGWTRAQVVAQQSSVYYDYTPATHRLVENSMLLADINLAGTALTGTDKRCWFDFLSSDGSGAYGATRDVIDTLQYTDIKSRITAAGAGTLYSLKREIVFLNRAGGK